jgi:hypothetical protein
MQPKAAGSSISLWSEHVRANPGSFSTTFAADQWEVQAGLWTLSPARVAAGQTQTRDQTAYATVPTQRNWQEQTVGSHPSPAQVSANRVVRNGSFETGGLT